MIRMSRGPDAPGDSYDIEVAAHGVPGRERANGGVFGTEKVQCGKQKIHLNNPGYKSQPKSLKSTFLIEHSISFVELLVNSQNAYTLYILLRRLVSLVQDVGLSKDGGNCEWG